VLFFGGDLLLQLADHAFVGLALAPQFQYLLLVADQYLLKLVVVLTDKLALHKHIA
jgi:hypothetical protein